MSVDQGLRDKFERLVIRREGCWGWNGGHISKGYTAIFHAGRQLYGHRVSYEIANGPVPEGLEVDHLCGNQGCTNPEHLEAVTHRENITRHFAAAVTHCVNGHEYTPENTYRRKSGRLCRLCTLNAQRRKRGAPPLTGVSEIRTYAWGGPRSRTTKNV